jgi:NAD kinase
VIPADQTIEVVLLERDETKASITVDGHSMGEIRPSDRMVISAADRRITLVHLLGPRQPQAKPLTPGNA